jgi:hypothetical protein
MLRNVRITPGMTFQAAESPSDLRKKCLVMSSKAHDQKQQKTAKDSITSKLKKMQQYINMLRNVSTTPGMNRIQTCKKQVLSNRAKQQPQMKAFVHQQSTRMHTISTWSSPAIDMADTESPPVLHNTRLVISSTSTR